MMTTTSEPPAPSSELLALDEPEMASELSATQMEMVLGDDRPKIDYSKDVFSYTAARLWRDRPDVAKAAIKLLAEPREVMPYRRVMKRLHMSYHLLRQLEISSASDIAKEKKNLGDVMLSVTEAYADRALETVQSSKGKEAVLAAAIAGDKYLQFRGEATQKIEIGVKVDVNAKIDNAYHAIMEKFENMKRAMVIEISEEPKTLNAQRPTSNVELLQPAEAAIGHE